jgi:hypothetical protein
MGAIASRRRSNLIVAVSLIEPRIKFQILFFRDLASRETAIPYA